MLGGHVDAVLLGHLEGVGALVDLDRDGAVVDLVGDGERGVVVVGRADEPQRVGHRDLAAVQHLRVAFPLGGHQVKHPFVLAGHFKHGKDFREVVLHARQVHLVEHNQARVGPQAGLVERAQKFRLVEALGELVEIAEDLRAVAVGRLHGNDGRRVVQVAAERIRQRRFTGTRNAFQDEQLAGGHAGHVAPHDLGRVVQLHLRCGERAVALDEALERDVVVERRRGGVAVFEVDQGKLGEAVGLGDRLVVGGCGGGCGPGNRGAARGRAGPHACGRRPTGHVRHRRQHVVGKRRSPHVRDALGAAHGVDLQRQKLVLLVHQIEHLLVQPADLAVERLVIRSVMLQAPIQLDALQQDERDEHRRCNEQRKQHN